MLILTALATLALYQAPPTAWRVVHVDPNGMLAVDVGSIRREGQTVSFWTADVFREEGDVGKYMVARYRLDCDGDEITMTNLIVYSSDHLPISTDDDDRGTLRDRRATLVPGTRNYNLQRTVCANDYSTASRPFTTTRDLVAASDDHFQGR